MAPTITNGEEVLADMFAYSYRSPKQWDAVAFRSPLETNQTWLMRVVGLPGNAISFASGGIAVDGKPLALPAHLTNIHYVSLDRMSYTQSSAVSPYTVPPDSYFVLGDNSTNAYDSRFWGALQRTNILAKILSK